MKVMFAGILQSQLSQGSLSQSDIKATVCGLKEVFALLYFFIYCLELEYAYLCHEDLYILAYFVSLV